jgi:hypothetical protein
MGICSKQGAGHMSLPSAFIQYSQDKDQTLPLGSVWPALVWSRPT